MEKNVYFFRFDRTIILHPTSLDFLSFFKSCDTKCQLPPALPTPSPFKTSALFLSPTTTIKTSCQPTQEEALRFGWPEVAGSGPVKIGKAELAGRSARTEVRGFGHGWRTTSQGITIRPRGGRVVADRPARTEARRFDRWEVARRGVTIRPTGGCVLPC